MSRKHFSWLLFLTFLVAMLVLLLPGKTGKESGFETAPLIPELQEQVNDIVWIRFTGGGGETIATLERREGRWVVLESSAYYADWDKLRRLLSDLAQAESVEAKTAKPEYYDRLGVEDVTSADAVGVMVEFDQAAGLPAVIIGKSAQGREGQYARLSGQEQSVLLDRRISVPRERSGWLETSIVSIADSDVVEVEVSHGDGDRILADRASVDEENFTLRTLPEGREVQSDWSINSLANGLASLTLDEVAAGDSVDWSDASVYRVVTKDGLQIEVELVAIPGEDEEASTDDEYWIRLEAGTYTTAVDSGVEEAGDAAAQAGEINRRVEGWAYRIPKYKFDSMTKKTEDLLKSPES